MPATSSTASILSTKIPTTVITGFLGCGKTTLIRHLLTQAQGKRIALIVNEFGDLGIDGGLLKGCDIENCDDDDIIELNNGCICCTVADDFIPAMSKILSREPRPDHIIIETSGLALPQPLIAAFNWPEISTQVTVDGVITLVDSPAVLQGQFADDPARLEAIRQGDEALDHETPLQELFEDQIRAADLIVLNKGDLLDDDALQQVRELVSSELTRDVPIIAARFAALHPDVVLGLGMGSEADIAQRKSHHELHHEGGEEHSHDDFTSFIVTMGGIGDERAFAARLVDIIREHHILRLKGFMAVAGKSMRLGIQAVGSRIDFYFDRPWREGEARASNLVVIGEAGLDSRQIQSAILATI